MGGYPLINGSGGVADEEVAISGKDGGLGLVDVLEFDGGAVDACALSRIRVFAVYGGVPCLPHDKKFSPDRGDDGGRPKEACFRVGSRFDTFEMLVLESSPFLGHTALEQLSPAKLRLLGYESVKLGREVVFINRIGVEPGCKAFDEDVDKIRACGETFTCRAESCKQSVLPRFSVRMGAA